MEPKKLNRKNKIPLYLQLISVFHDNIKAGIWKEGQKLPSEKELAEQYGVSVITVRLALENLSEESVINKIQGKGSFVNKSPDSKYNLRFSDLKSFTEKQSQLNYNAGARLLGVKKRRAARYEANIFEIPEDGNVVEIIRIRTVNDIPTMISTMVVNEELGNWLSEQELSGSVYDLLRKRGIILKVGKETIEAAMPTKEQSKILSLPLNTPVLLSERISYDEHGNVIYITKSVINSNLMKITVEIK